jgi:hypothetical protein
LLPAFDLLHYVGSDTIFGPDPEMLDLTGLAKQADIGGGAIPPLSKTFWRKGFGHS